MSIDMNSASGASKPHYGVQLRGGGRLVFLEWNEEEGRHIERTVPDGEISEFLWSTVCLREEVSLRDIMLLVERDDTLFSVLCCCPHIPSLLDEMRKEPTNHWENDEHAPVGLELGWAATLYDGLFVHDTVFSGRAATGETLGIEFSSVADLADLPVTLEENFVLIDEDEPMEAVFAAKRQFTVFDVVAGVLSELTVLGGPGDRDALAEDIRQRVRDVQSGKSKSYTMEEVMEHMAVKAEEARRRFPCRECGKDARCACFGKPADLCHDCFLNMKEN